MKKILFTFVMTAMLLPHILPAAPAPEKSRPRRSPEWNRRMQRHIWRAFSELSDEERKKISELQRNDPEKFREVMHSKAQELLKAERQERQKLADLSKRYLNSKDENEKKQIKQQTAEILRRRFAKRLAANRRHLENMKRRTDKLEKELNRRAANSEKIIELQTDAVLSGKRLHPPMKRRPGGPREAKPQRI